VLDSYWAEDRRRRGTVSAGVATVMNGPTSSDPREASRTLCLYTPEQVSRRVRAEIAAGWQVLVYDTTATYHVPYGVGELLLNACNCGSRS